MTGMLNQAGRWFLQRMGGTALVLALSVGAAGFWLYFKETWSLEEQRTALLQSLSGQRSHLQQARGLAERRREQYSTERGREQERLRIAEGAIRSLGGLESNWEGLFGDREQQRDYAHRKAELEGLALSLRKRVEELAQLIDLETYTLDGLDLALGKVEKRSAEAREAESRFVHYLRSAWEQVRWHVLTVLLTWLFAPILLRLIGYYLIAPWISRRRPIRFAEQQPAVAEVEQSQAALELELNPGETLRVRERHLQASDEDLRKRTRLLFDWRMPFTSLACHLTEMMDLEHSGANGVRRVTLSDSRNPLCEVSIVRIPDGASLILRPSAIAGVVLRAGEQPRIRRRWLFSRVQAWMMLQFRYFEFEGPQRVVLAGGRGVRLERLGDADAEGARRVNATTIIGFSPTLDYRPVRAETFWAYHRGQNPLFDELFSGRGIFLCQASSAKEAPAGQKFWHGLGGGIMKLLGF